MYIYIYICIEREVCMYMCAYIHIHIHIYIHTYIHTYAYMSLTTYMLRGSGSRVGELWGPSVSGEIRPLDLLYTYIYIYIYIV